MIIHNKNTNKDILHNTYEFYKKHLDTMFATGCACPMDYIPNNNVPDFCDDCDPITNPKCSKCLGV